MAEGRFNSGYQTTSDQKEMLSGHNGIIVLIS